MQKYRLTEQIGQGGFALTWLAQERLNTNKNAAQYVVKELCLDKIDHWKAVEQFEREARVLSHLKHKNIPEYIDFIEEEHENGKRLFLVQALIQGNDLESLIKTGKHFTENDVQAIATTLAEVLTYLQDFSPSIIHRDIKPSNIMLRDSDSQVYLIDFGAVKGPAQVDSEQGATITGTFGYMPLEQAEGQAVPATDIYALGMTLVYILSHTDPTRLPKQGLKVDFRPYVNISEPFAKIIDKMIEPDLKKRYATAQILQQDLAKLKDRTEPLTANKKNWKSTAIAVFVFAGVTGAAYFELAAPPEGSEPFPQSESSPVSMTYSEHKRLADQHYNNQGWSQAVTAYQAYLKAVPKDTEALFRLGYCAGKNLDHAIAVKAYLQLEQIDSQAYSSLFYNLGYNYYKLDQTPQSIAYFKQMLTRDAKHLGSLNYLGLIYLKQKNYGLSKSYFDKVLALDPNYKYSLNNYGEWYQRQNKPEQALAYFQRAAKSDPDYALPYYNQAEVYYDQKKITDCVQAATQAIDKAKTYASAYNQRGLCYRGLKQWNVAIKDFEMATQQSPTYASAHYNLGLTYDDQGNLEKAEHFYLEALKVKGTHDRSLNNLGYIYERQKKDSLALEKYTFAIAVNPKAMYYNNRGGIYQQLKQCTLAQADYKIACQKGHSKACKKTCP